MFVADLKIAPSGTQPHPCRPFSLHQRFVRPAKSRRVFAIEHDKGRLEGDVAKDIDAEPAAALQAAKARRRAGRDALVVEIGRRDRDSGRSDAKRQGGQRRGAREHVTAVGPAVGGARDLTVVGRYDGRRQVQQRGARVGNARDGVGREARRADGVARRCPGPVARTGIDGHVRELSRVFGLVDEAKVVGAGLRHPPQTSQPLTRHR